MPGRPCFEGFKIDASRKFNEVPSHHPYFSDSTASSNQNQEGCSEKEKPKFYLPFIVIEQKISIFVEQFCKVLI